MARSVVRQTLHYLSRRHIGLPSGPVGGPAAWTTDTVSDWVEELDEEQVAAIERALDGGRAILQGQVARWRDLLIDGRGFLVLRGLPVDRWDQARSEQFFVALGDALGVTGAQNPAGDLLGHVTDHGVADDRTSRAYKTRQHIAFHCDTADLVGLFCLRPAARGGRSRIASSVSVHDALWEQERTLAERLYAPFTLDTKAQGGLRYFPVEPCRWDGAALRTFWHSDYYRESQRWPDAPRLDAVGQAALDAYDALALDPRFCLELDFEPGDVQLVNNHTIVHARTAYEDDPDAPRHLLRLWLSVPGRGGSGDPRTWARLLGRLVVNRVRQAGGPA